MTIRNSLSLLYKRYKYYRFVRMYEGIGDVNDDIYKKQIIAEVK